MATCNISLVRVSGGRADTGATMPIPDDVPVGSQKITSFATSTQSTVVAPEEGWEGLFWRIASDVATDWAVGADPEIGSTEGEWSPGPFVEYRRVTAGGLKIAVQVA